MRFLIFSKLADSPADTFLETGLTPQLGGSQPADGEEPPPRPHQGKKARVVPGPADYYFGHHRLTLSRSHSEAVCPRRRVKQRPVGVLLPDEVGDGDGEGEEAMEVPVALGAAPGVWGPRAMQQ